MRRIFSCKLDNRGFAITGILYTLFILFLLVLVSVLAALRTKRDMLESSTSVLSNSFEGIRLDEEEVSLINKVFTEQELETVRKKAIYDGKYVFRLYNNYNEYENEKDKGFVCSVYLHKDDVISSLEDEKLSFIPKDCNDYAYSFSFEISNKDSFQGRVMSLIEIYSFEEE